ncbi:DNA polymerase III [Chitinophaga sp. CF418]|uniref:DNA polymerase III n=1 Tax=Chitinophaga sp. CF418 TaxID=1855287 RepID=UPI000914F94C|nr:DNA polymerase III [Chitinophaga sp. CF418]SHN28583.1 DNA polymerase (family 10) [Chitinophaga sp. CF418]
MTVISPATSSHCKEYLAEIYHNMSACYRYQGRVTVARAYERIAIEVSKLKNDISNYLHASGKENPLHLPDTVMKDLNEFATTGTLRKYMRLIQKVPVELLEILEVNGFGSKLVRKLYEELNINTIEQLKDFILSGKLKRVRGISNAKIDHLKRSLKLYKSKGTRLLLWDAILQGNEILRVIRLIPEVEAASLSGSLRRGGETVGDIDMVVNVAEEDRERFLQHLMQVPQVQNIAAAGRKRVSAVLYNDTQLDIRIADDSSYGAALLYYTGSLEHAVQLSERAQKKGFNLTADGLFDVETGAWVAGRTEEEIYRRLGLSSIPPELREGGREIFRAARNMLPELINASQIKGDMRIHSVYGKGEEAISSIAHYALNAFPHYEYIVISDQLPAEVYPEQFAEIDRVNNILGFPFLKKGIVVDIAEDGGTGIPDELLQQADWVTAVINETDADCYRNKLVQACEHPYINCIANPTGRIIGQHEPGPQDWPQIFRKASLSGTALEINAQPQRLDLSDHLLKGAAEKGVKIVINSCAQLCSHYDYMQMGVTMARRGWCSRGNVLNTLPWDEVQRFKQLSAVNARVKPH